MKDSATISRSEKNPKVAYVLFPNGMLEDCSEFDIEYDDGLVIRFIDGGRYKVGENGSSWRLNIPAAFVGYVPFGLTQCEVERVDLHTVRLIPAPQAHIR